MIGMLLPKFYRQSAMPSQRAKLMRLNAITATLGIIWVGLRGARKLFQKAQLWWT
jgi:hypothetical protein